MQAFRGPLCAAVAFVVSSLAPVWAGQIVTFQPGVSPEVRRALVEKAGGTVLRELKLVEGLEVEFGMSPQAAFRLKADPSVESVEPDAYRKWIEAAFPSPAQVLKAAAPVPAIGPQAPAAPAKPSEVPWGVSRVGAPQVWGRATGAGVKVAVIDTGIDASHPDIAPNYAGGYNAVDPSAEAGDDHGHGTHVAGTIAGAPNDKGVIGVAPRARLYAVKVLDKDGGGTTAAIVAGIEWCVENGMRVVNMSLGGPSSTAMRKAVRAAYAAGVTVVAASGNDPESPVSAPASYPEAIAVSASTSDDALAEFSTTGPEVDVIAPGHEIVSAWPGSRLAKLSGTSMASPHVAGLAALAVELGAKSPAQVKQLIQRSAAPLPGLSEEQQGAGLPNAERWLQ